MKIIKYTLKGFAVEMPWNEVNEEIAKREADNGKYIVEEQEDEGIW